MQADRAFCRVSVSSDYEVKRGMVAGPLEDIQVHEGVEYHVRTFWELRGTNQLVPCKIGKQGKVQHPRWAVRLGEKVDLDGLTFCGS